jgi:hypothetical protein
MNLLAFKLSLGNFSTSSSSEMIILSLSIVAHRLTIQYSKNHSCQGFVTSQPS